MVWVLIVPLCVAWPIDVPAYRARGLGGVDGEGIYKEIWPMGELSHFGSWFRTFGGPQPWNALERSCHEGLGKTNLRERVTRGHGRGCP